MKLLKATVKNYRVIRERTVDFATDDITVIYGPNESGKSTFIEAIRACLFVKSATSGKLQQSMKSNAGGIPEVELVLDVSGKRVTVKKTFSGNNGSTVLTGLGGDALMSTDAEKCLGDLLHDGEGTAEGGTNNEKKFANRFTNLFILQGNSGKLPFEILEDSGAGSLTSALGRMGAGTVLQSQTDTEVLDGAKELVDEWFSTKGARAGSTLANALNRRDEAEHAVNTCKETLVDIQSIAKDIDAMETGIATEQERLARYQEVLDSAQKRAADINTIRQKMEPDQKTFDDALGKLNALDAAEKDIQHAWNALAGKKAKCDEAENALAELQDQVAFAEKAFLNAEKARKDAEQQERDLLASSRKASELLSFLDALQQEQDLAGKEADIWEKENEVAELESQIGALPSLSPKIVADIHALNSDAQKKEAALKALAAHIDVARTDVPILVNGVPVPEGGIDLVDDAEIAVSGALLQLRLGGRDGLAGARKAAHDAKEMLRQTLASNSCASIADMDKAWGTLQQWETLLKSARNELRKTDRQGIANALKTVRDKIRVARAQFDNEGIAEPMEAQRDKIRVDQAQADAKRKNTQPDLGDKRRNENDAKASLDDLRQKADVCHTALQSMKGDVAKLEGGLDVLLKQHGDDVARATNRAQWRNDLEGARQNLAALETEIQSIDPDGTAEADMASAENNLNASRKRLEEARLNLSKKKGALSQATGGRADPSCALLDAQAILDREMANAERLEREGEARKRLLDVFQSVRESLNRDMAQPLQDKITPYLEALWGTSFGVHVAVGDLSKGSNTELRFGNTANSDGFSHKDLSGGTREQVGVATLLACAEVFAADHNGSLPVFLDDAFVNSDPSRIKGVNRMLKLAKDRGLQIIVLSCSEHDYDDIARNLVSF